jgi:hypothetical protein
MRAAIAGKVSTTRALPLPLPKSGLPDFGINNAQVGQARPAWERVGVRGRLHKLRVRGETPLYLGIGVVP